jgi:iron complex transport system ATP-binding protein
MNTNILPSPHGLAHALPAQRTADSNADSGPALRTRGLGLSLGSRTLFSNLSVAFQPGRITALLGPNGAGKSSLLHLLAGLRSPDTGTVSLNGQGVRIKQAPELARLRAVVPQENQVAFDFTAQEVVEMGRYPHRLQPAPDEAQIVAQAMSRTDSGGHAERLLATLSGGEKARVQLARALAQVWHAPLCGQPRWLLLDEPTAAMDLAHQHRTFMQLQAWSRDHGVGVVAVVHDLNLALRYADDALLLGAGHEPVFGTIQAVLTPERVTQYWGVQCEPVSTGGVPQFLFSGPPSRNTATTAHPI